MSNNLSLYQVLGAGRSLVGTFGSKIAALKAMRKINSNLKKGESPVFVSPGPDHWRAKENRKVPKRGAEPVWTGEGDNRTLIYVPSATYWL